MKKLVATRQSNIRALVRKIAFGFVEVAVEVGAGGTEGIDARPEPVGLLRDLLRREIVEVLELHALRNRLDVEAIEVKIAGVDSAPMFRGGLGLEPPAVPSGLVAVVWCARRKERTARVARCIRILDAPYAWSSMENELEALFSAAVPGELASVGHRDALCRSAPHVSVGVHEHHVGGSASSSRTVS